MGQKFVCKEREEEQRVKSEEGREKRGERRGELEERRGEREEGGGVWKRRMKKAKKMISISQLSQP